MTDDLAVNGLVDFSLRRAARAASTTHKVLALYHFDGAEDLLAQAIFQLRERRIGNALAAIAAGPEGRRWRSGSAPSGPPWWARNPGLPLKIETSRPPVVAVAAHTTLPAPSLANSLSELMVPADEMPRLPTPFR